MKKKEMTITAFLSKNQLKHLDCLGRKARESGGRKISRNAILRALARLAREMNVDVRGIRTEKELIKRLELWQS